MRIGSTVGSNAKLYSKLPLIWSDGPIRVLSIDVYPDLQNTIHANYKDRKTRIENILKVWSTRSLSLLGKVLIINTLVVSQLVYCFQCLPTPDNNYLREIDSMVRDFVWNGKKSKISMSRLKYGYLQGGLKLVDLKLKAHSIKFSSYNRLYDLLNGSGLIKRITSCIVNVPVGSLRSANLSPKYVAKKIERCKGYRYLLDVNKAWYEHRFEEPNSRVQVLDQPLWYSEHIQIANNICCPQDPLAHEPKLLCDILDCTTNKPVKYQEFKTRFPKSKVSFLGLLSLQAAIPRIWYRLLKIEGAGGEPKVRKIEKNQSKA